MAKKFRLVEFCCIQLNVIVKKKVKMRWKTKVHILIFWISKELHQKDQYLVKGEHYNVR
jgi:hypothetical protein